MADLTPEVIAELREALQRAESLEGWFTTAMIADALDCTERTARDTLRSLLRSGRLDKSRKTVSEGYLAPVSIPVYRLRD